MTGAVDRLAMLLKAACDAAPKDRRVASIHLFGIAHRAALDGVNKYDLAERAGLPRSYGSELAKGAVLGEYVTISKALV